MSTATQPPKRSIAEKLAIRIPSVWLVVFFLLPLLIVLRISVSQSTETQPYEPVFDVTAGWQGIVAFFNALSFDNYRGLGTDPAFLLSVVKSVEIAAFSTLLLLIVGFPIAYGITRAPRRVQAVLMTFVMLPFWIAVVVRVYAWVNILQPDGLLNRLLLALHIVREPPVWLATDTATFIGIVYAYLPLMVLPLYVTLAKLDEMVLEAAADLGCPRWRIFWDVTLPLSSPGVLTGALLCFVFALGEFVIPDLLGSAQAPMIGQSIWTAFFGDKDWPTAAAIAVVLICLVAVPLVLVQHQAMRATEKA